MNSFGNSSCFLFYIRGVSQNILLQNGNTNGNSDPFDIVFSIVGTGKQQCSFPHF